MRTNPAVERLEWENKKLREQIDRMREEPAEIPFVACDNSCLVARSRGMGTNGGCRCDEDKLKRAVQWWRHRAFYLQATILTMTEGRPEEEYRNLAEKYIGVER